MSTERDTTRRAVLKATGIALAGASTAGCVGAVPRGPATEAGDRTVEVGPDGEFAFRPGTDEPLGIDVGTTVRFVWRSDGHNVVVESQPADSNWEGSPGGPGELHDEGFSFRHSFDVVGEYRYFCVPHEPLGMTGVVVVS